MELYKFMNSCQKQIILNLKKIKEKIKQNMNKQNKGKRREESKQANKQEKGWGIEN